MTKSVKILLLGAALIFATSGCSDSGEGEPLTAVSASRILQDLPGLCPDIDIKLQAADEPRSFTEGGEEIVNPGLTHISCGLEASKTSLFVFADEQEKAQAQKFSCLNFAASNPTLVNAELSGEDWDVIWLNGTNWEGYAFEYPANEVATALGGTASPRRDNCKPHVEAMLAVAANPLAPEPELEKALNYLYAMGYPLKDQEGLVMVLDLFCDFLATMDEESVIDGFAGNRENALVTKKQAEQFIAALKYANYDCTKHKVSDD